MNVELAALRMMGCLLQGVMNLYPPSASLKDSRITLCHNRVDTHNAHIHLHHYQLSLL